MTTHSAIASATAVSRIRASGEAELVVFYVTHSGRSIDVAELRNGLSARLPEYVVPSAFVHRDKLPMTPNGKVDRKALASLATTMDTDRRTSGASPVTELEKSIANVFSEALAVADIRMDDNFFHMGSNSLTLVRVASKLNEMFPGRVGLVDLFHHTTIHSLARFLSDSSTPVETRATLGSNRGRHRRDALLARRQN